MRKMLAVALCLGTAACGGGDDKKAEAPPAQLPAGTWQVASEVTAFRSTDGAPPVVPAKVGDKAGASVCVDKASAQPAPGLFAGEGERCTYKTAYIKEGMINATLECRREGVNGMVMVSVQGSYTATGFTATADATSYFSQPGRFQMSRKLTGTVKPGACTPAPAAGSDEDEGADIKAG